MKFVVFSLLLLLLIIISTFPLDLEEFRGHRHRHSRRTGRSWWGPRWGYRYRPPRIIWYNPAYWFSGACKTGCSNIGRGRWGCTHPGPGPNDCWFASDCNWCGY